MQYVICLALRASAFQILPGVKVIIANTETKGPLGDSHLGEVSDHTAKKIIFILQQD